MKYQPFDEYSNGRNLDRAILNGGYIWIQNTFVDKILPRLTPLAIKVYLFLVRYTCQTKEFEPITWKELPATKIAKAIGSNRTSVFNAISELEIAEVIERFQEEPGSGNYYRLLNIPNK